MINALAVEYIQSHNIQKGDIVDFVDAAGHYICQAKVLGVRENTVLVELISLNLTMEVRRSDLLKLIPYNGSIEQKEDIEKREKQFVSRSFAKMMEHGI